MESVCRWSGSIVEVKLGKCIRLHHKVRVCSQNVIVEETNYVRLAGTKL